MKNGGLNAIIANIGIRPFVFYVAKECSCTFRKAQEYIEIVKMSAIAERKIEELALERHTETEEQT